MLGEISSGKRRSAECLGRAAEDNVAMQWVARGYGVLARRLRTPAGEVDLVVANPKILVFIEVKARKSLYEAVYSVGPRQQARLLAAANVVLAEHEDWHRPDTRFDVALVCNGAIHHIEDAIRYN